MAAYAALVSLMSNMEQMMSHPQLSNSFDKHQIQSLEEKAGLLLDIIESNNYGGVSKEAKDLESRIASAAHAAEDVIESHIVELIFARSIDYGKSSYRFLLNVQHKSSIVKKMVQEWERKIACAADAVGDAVESDVVDQIEAGTICLLDLEKSIQDMDGVLEKAREVIREIGGGEGGGSREEQSSNPRAIGEKAESAAVGLEEQLNQLRDNLTGYHHPGRQIISIVGMGGMGKTTLARSIYADPFILEHFDILAWVTVSQQFDAHKIITQLLSSLGKSVENIDKLGEKLYKSLIGRRYLIVLDDIWSVKAWDEVRRFLPDEGNISSRVVLTTRESNVSSDCGSSSFEMKLLDEGKSWKLFCEKAKFPQKDDPLQLVDVGRNIVRSCKGLALSIVVIGGLLLSSPRTVGFWEQVSQSLKSISDLKEKQQSLDILSLSYIYMPPRLKPCFLYMGAFKEDSEIHVSNITKMWVAEGFIKPNGCRLLEEIAEGYLNDLLDRNLILGGRRRCNGKLRTCGIHDLLRDLCLREAKEQKFFHEGKENGILQGIERRLIHVPYQGHIEAPLTRSVLISNRRKESVECKMLRVLHESSHDSLLQLYRNFNLRYLDYEHSYDTRGVLEIPTRVPLIWNLQSLIIQLQAFSTRPVVAPSAIWKMRQLRHVKCRLIYLPDPPPSSEGDDVLILENLQTLKRAVNLRLCEEVCNIIPNVKKLHLVYGGEMQGYDDSLLTCLGNLDRLHRLESLKMTMMRGSKWPSRDDEVIDRFALPNALNKLSLEECNLDWDDLGIIGSLPQLQVLNLGRNSVTEGGQWSPVTGEFAKLGFLKIQECGLVNWDADESHFPLLEKLVLIGLDRLEAIPLDMGEISTLEFIRVHMCSESAAISALKIKKEHLENYDNDDTLQIQVRVSYLEEAAFKEMMEREQLTLNDIQLESGYY